MNITVKILSFTVKLQCNNCLLMSTLFDKNTGKGITCIFLLLLLCVCVCVCVYFIGKGGGDKRIPFYDTE